MKLYTGINIQYPISRLIMDGSKTIETRVYPIPEKYVGKELAFIETPGKDGNFKARVVGIICFSSCFKYESEEVFYDDFKKHKIDKASPYSWRDEKPKWGWIIKRFTPLEEPIDAPEKKGIKFTKNISL